MMTIVEDEEEDHMIRDSLSTLIQWICSGNYLLKYLFLGGGDGVGGGGGSLFCSVEIALYGKFIEYFSPWFMCFLLLRIQNFKSTCFWLLRKF